MQGQAGINDAVRDFADDFFCDQAIDCIPESSVNTAPSAAVSYGSILPAKIWSNPLDYLTRQSIRHGTVLGRAQILLALETAEATYHNRQELHTAAQADTPLLVVPISEETPLSVTSPDSAVLPLFSPSSTAESFPIDEPGIKKEEGVIDDLLPVGGKEWDFVYPGDAALPAYAHVIAILAGEEKPSPSKSSLPFLAVSAAFTHSGQKRRGKELSHLLAIASLESEIVEPVAKRTRRAEQSALEQ